MQLIKKTKTTYSQRGGSGRSSKSKRNNNTNNNSLRRRLLELKLPEVPATLQNPIPRTYKVPDVIYEYIKGISRKNIPNNNDIDKKTEELILLNLLKLNNFRDEFASIETLYACIEFISRLVNDKIIQLRKILQKPQMRSSRTSNMDIKRDTIVLSWIEYFSALQTLLSDEKHKLEPLIKNVLDNR